MTKSFSNTFDNFNKISTSLLEHNTTTILLTQTNDFHTEINSSPFPIT